MEASKPELAEPEPEAWSQHMRATRHGTAATRSRRRRGVASRPSPDMSESLRGDETTRDYDHLPEWSSVAV